MRKVLKRLSRAEWALIGLVAVLLAVLFLPLNPDNTLPALMIAPAKRAPSPGQPQNVEILLTGCEPQQYGLTLQFILVNRTDRTYYYSGYAPESFMRRPLWGQIHPLYAKQIKRDGVWRPKPIGWCGVGAKRMRLKPGHAGRFTAHLWSDASLAKIGVYCAESQDARMTDDQIVWSEEIPFDAGALGKERPRD